MSKQIFSISNKFGFILVLIGLLQFLAMIVGLTGQSPDWYTVFLIPILAFYFVFYNTLSSILINIFNTHNMVAVQEFGNYEIPIVGSHMVLIAGLILYLILLFLIGKLIGKLTEKIKHGRANHIS